jgi:CheY-like chemotaxis protein
MDGMDVARELRDGARTRWIPVVALSALRFEGDDIRLAEAGFAGSLAKPINVAGFPDQVRRYVLGERC